MSDTSPLFLSPADLGLPEKFDSWRPHQEEAVLRAASCDQRIALQICPTGFGKSLSYVASGLLRGGRTAILTSTKGLMQQLMNDFSEIGAVEIKGRNSYPCVWAGGGISCEEGPCVAGVKCDFRADCKYQQALMQARKANLVITNYAYWLSANTYIDGGLGKFNTLVCDEGHDADAQVASFLMVEFNRRDDWLHPLLPHFPDRLSMEDWLLWIKDNSGRLSAEVENLSQYVKGGSQSALKRLIKLKKIQRDFNFLSEVEAENMVIEVRPDVIQFAPKWVSAWCSKYLFGEVPHIILTSASICMKTAEMLGLFTEDCDLFEAPHLFPLEHRLMTHLPTVRVNFRMTEDDKQFWLKRIDQIIRDRRDRNGIIHTVSYERRDFVLTQSFYRSIMMSHSSKDTLMKVREFKESKEPRILVSPSMTTGWDFPDAECRYQIIGKLAYPDSRSQLVQARMEGDPDYAPYVAMQQLVQACGRGVRSESDWCETFIIDDNIGWFMRRYGKFAPKWFRDSFVKRITVPPAPAI